MSAWRNAVLYQVVWFCVVLSAADARPWMGILVALLFVVAQWLLSRQRASDARLVLCAVACGVLIDGVLGGSGLLRYAGHDGGWLAPAWILSLWAAFAMTLNHSMTFFRERIRWVALLGLIGGPLAYAGAASRLGAVDFPVSPGAAIALLAVTWAAALAALMAASRRWAPLPASSPEPVTPPRRANRFQRLAARSLR